MSKHILEKRLFVESLTPGMEVADLFLIAVAQQAQAKNGPYWRLEFRDAHGSISGKIWSPQSQNYPEISPGIALVTGRVTSYRDQPEIAVDSIRPLTAEESAGLDLSLFMPAAARSPHDMLKDLGRLAVGALSHDPWKRFVAAVLADPEIAQGLPTAPAAKAMHHAYVGGLLEHTLSVCGLCMRLCDHYPALDRQTLFAGALCHDLGKIWELSPGLVADYTTQGRLIGHMSIALERLAPLMREAGLEPEYADHLRHLILSHHGTREFGSPVLPATAEALALHYADNVDAKLNQIASTLNTALGAAETGWSAYVPALERTLYRAPKSPEPESATEAEAETETEPDFEFGPLLYDDRLCEEFDPNFHLNDMADFPEFLFDDSDALPEKTFLPAEASSKSQTPPPPTSAKTEPSHESTVEAAAPATPKADKPAPSSSPTEAQPSDTADSEAAASAPSAAQPEKGQVEASLSSDTAKPVEASASVTDDSAAEAAPVAETEPAASPVEAVANLSKTEAAPEKISSLEAAEIPKHSSASASDPTDATPQKAPAIPAGPTEEQASETGAEPSAAAASEASPTPAESDAPTQTSPEAESTEAPPTPKKKRAPRGSRAKAAATAAASSPETPATEAVSSDAQPAEAPSSEAASAEMHTDNVPSSDPTTSVPTPSEAKSPPAEAPASASAQADAPAPSEPGEDTAASPAPKKKKAAPKIESLSLLG